MALSDWLEVKLPQLDSTFDWPIPSVVGISFFSTIPYGRHQSNAKENVALKDFLSEQWVSSNSLDDRLKIARWVVINWGGISTNSDRTIEKHVRVAEIAKPRYRHAGIASLSKILAASNPDTFAVYDARVAAALNAIQLQAKLEKGIAFRYGSGRNGLISGKRDASGNLIADGFQQKNPWSSFEARSWLVPNNGENYLTYLALLFEYKDRIPGRRLVELEMTLFANAVDVCRGIP